MSVRGDHRVANVLITAAGRRATLVRSFADAAHARGGRVTTSDVDALAPALLVGDAAVRAPRTDDPGYVDQLLRIVDDHAIGILIPTIDPDLPVLAACSSAFLERECRVIVSATAFIETVLDKYQTARAFGAAGFDVPRTWLPAEGPAGPLPERVFVKPRRGSASIDTYEVASASLHHVLALVDEPVIQEVLRGPEITIDALLDLDGVPIHYVPRQRIRAVGGESVQGVTLSHDAALAAWIERVLDASQALGASGPLTLQAFLTERGPVLTEINARFGGGFPLALEAGAQYPAWIMDMAAGERIEPRLGEYEAGLYMTRHHEERFLRQPPW